MSQPAPAPAFTEDEHHAVADLLEAVMLERYVPPNELDVRATRCVVSKLRRNGLTYDSALAKFYAELGVGAPDDAPAPDALGFMCRVALVDDRNWQIRTGVYQSTCNALRADAKRNRAYKQLVKSVADIDDRFARTGAEMVAALFLRCRVEREVEGGLQPLFDRLCAVAKEAVPRSVRKCLADVWTPRPCSHGWSPPSPW